MSDTCPTGSYWPGQHWKQPSTPYAPTLRGRIPLSPCPRNTFGTKGNHNPAHKTLAMAITNSTLGSRPIQEWLKKFQNFHLGRGSFGLRLESKHSPKITIKSPPLGKDLYKTTGRRKGKTLLLTPRKLFILSDSRSPKHSYHAWSGTLTARHSPSPARKVISTVVEGFILPRAKLPLSIKGGISVVKNQKIFVFSGAHQASDKVPNLSLLVTNDKGLPKMKL